MPPSIGRPGGVIAIRDLSVLIANTSTLAPRAFHPRKLASLKWFQIGKLAPSEPFLSGVFKVGQHRHKAHMAKLYFHYSTMNAGKSTLLLQAAHNYQERGMQTYLLTARIDYRAGSAQITSRIGIGQTADTFAAGDDLFSKLKIRQAKGEVACVFVDEAQFLSRDQVWQLARAVDDLNLPIMCYGLRVDFRGNLFPGSAALLALADEMREVRTICHCGKKATMVIRQDDNGNIVNHGDQVQIGGNQTYVSLCRRHWREAMDR